MGCKEQLTFKLDIKIVIQLLWKHMWLIFQVMNKELKAIGRLGALLGLVMGGINILI